MAITVQCNYGAGDRPLPAVVSSLITTEVEAINRGYAELNKAWKIIHTYEITIPYPENGHLLSVGEHVKVTCTEVGLIDEILYIAGISYQGKNTGTLIRLTLERYEDFEG